MTYTERLFEKELLRAAKAFPSVVLTGPRRAGKTHLLRHLFPKAQYHLLEDPDTLAKFRSDPHGFLDALKFPVILDEVQNVPEIFNYVRSRIDADMSRKGRWFLTGSQEAQLMKGVTESMTGRSAIMQLMPFSRPESTKVGMLLGGFPEVVARPRDARLWFSSYLQSYVERDVRSVTSVKDLSTFRRFMGLLATRHGQLLNKSALAGPLGVSVPTISQWLDILERTMQVLIVPPFYENFGKRLTRSPKVYIADPGLACHLLGIDTAAELGKSPFVGAIFEGLVAAEILKHQLNTGRRRELYHFRDEQGLEVDLVVPGKSGSLTLVECKASRTVHPRMAASMQRLIAAGHAKLMKGRKLKGMLVHQPPTAGQATKVVVPGIQAHAWTTFTDHL